MGIPDTSILNTINNSQDLKLLKKSDLGKLCEELREFIIDIVSKNGGHFGGTHFSHLRGTNGTHFGGYKWCPLGGHR